MQYVMQHHASVLTWRLNKLINDWWVIASPSSASCVPSRFQTPSQSLVLKEGQASLPDNARGDSVTARDTPPTAIDNGDHIRLDSSQVYLTLGSLFFLHVFQHMVYNGIFFGVLLLLLSCFLSQNAVVYSSQVHSLGRYVFILHYHQPLHPTFTVQIYVNAGRIWQGEDQSAMLHTVTHVFSLQVNEAQEFVELFNFSSITGHANATFCPHGYGCRSVLISENQIILDVTDHEVIVTVQVPDGKTLWLVRDKHWNKESFSTIITVWFDFCVYVCVL